MKSKERKFFRMFSISLTGGLSIALLVIGCATIIHGTKQDIGISSAPTGASVSIDNASYGKTPLIAKLSRGDNHIVKIELPGYEPFEATITRSVSGWVWGNIVFGGLIGLAVDAISGGLYKLSPEQLSATLNKQGSGLLYQGDAIYVAVVFQADSNWKRIGTLTAVDGTSNIH